MLYYLYLFNIYVNYQTHLSMKKLIFLFSIIFLFSCQKRNTPPELLGTWKLVSLEILKDGTPHMKANDDSMKQLKSWSKQHFIFAGKTTNENQVSYSFGNGKYTLNGNRYIENIKVHTSSAYEGINNKLLLEIKGDTLIQIFPVTNSWTYDKENCWIEKYVKVD